MALNLKKKAAATESKTITDKKVVISEDVVTKAVEVPANVLGQAQKLTPWCEVGVEASYTHNLGNFQSCRVAVSLKVPCPHDEIDKVFEYAQTWVDGKMNTMMSDLQNG